MTETPKEDAAKAALRKAREERLAEDLAVTDDWIERLADPQLGHVGTELKKAIAGSDLSEKPDMDMRLNAVFNSYVYPPNEGEKSLKNELVYGLPALDSKAVLFGARCHEFIHALQYEMATAIHAHPFNAATTVILHPMDYARVKEMLEQDAYAKGAWLQSLAKDIDPDIGQALDKTPMPVHAFEDIRRQSPSLSQTFTEAAKHAGAAEGKWLADNSVGPARDLWHENALMEYSRVMGVRAGKAEVKFVYARLEEEDLREIGRSFGIDTFDGNLTPKLSAANKARLEVIEAILRPGEYADLPTLSEALAAQKTTRDDFRHTSRTYTGPKKPAA